jgi:hypothetical protein
MITIMTNKFCDCENSLGSIFFNPTTIFFAGEKKKSSLVSLIPLVSFVCWCHSFFVLLFCCAIFRKMAHEKSKHDNVKTIESLLPTLSRAEKQDLFAKFVEAGKNQSQNVISTFETTSAKQANKSSSRKRSSEASMLNLDSASKKVLTMICQLYSTEKS